MAAQFVMPTYGVAGLRLTTEIRLPQLRVAPDEHRGPEWRLVSVPSRPAETTVPTFEHRRVDGTLWSTVAHRADRVDLDFPGRAHFSVRLRSRIVELWASDGLPDDTLQHLVVDQLVPHLLAASGSLVLHASAVALGGVAVAFVAPSGFGKSSLAAALVGDGAELLTDDYLLLEEAGSGFVATAAYPGLRLWEDSAGHFAGTGPLARVADYTAKVRWDLPEDTVGSVPLGCVIALGRQPGPGQPDCRIGRLKGRAAFQVVFGQVFRAERPPAAGQRDELDRFMRLVEQVPVLLMEYRRDYALLPEVVASVRSAAVSDVGS